MGHYKLFKDMGHSKLMNKYQDGKIYKLESAGLYYYGSTIQKLNDRISNHKALASKCSSKKLYETGEEVKFSIVELFPCYNRQQLLFRERWWIENNECINIKLPISTKEEAMEKKAEYNIKHKEDKKEYDKINREAKKEYYLKLNKCECGGSYKTKHKTTHFKTKKHINYNQK